jgi:tetratricopeptide (TPR) repeat protein
LAFDKEKTLINAQKYVLKGQSEKAIKEYEKLVKASPKDIRSHLKLGDLLLKNSENEKAIGEYLKVAELYVEEDLSSRAISIYKKVLSIDPRHIEALHRTANLYLKEGLKGDARNYYQAILKVRPNDQDATNALRTIEDHHVPKEPPKKAPPIEHAPVKHRHAPEKRDGEHVTPPPSASTITPSPTPPSPGLSEAEISSVDKDAEMHYHLGIAYKEMELYDYAISEFEMASSSTPMTFDCYIMLGDCFMQKGDLDKSIEHYRTASGLKGLSDEKLARLHFNLGCAYEANGMASEALDAFTLVLKLDHSIAEAEEKIRRLQKKREN